MTSDFHVDKVSLWGSGEFLFSSESLLVTREAEDTDMGQCGQEPAGARCRLEMCLHAGLAERERQALMGRVSSELGCIGKNPDSTDPQTSSLSL